MNAPRLGLCRTPQWPAARPETHKLFEELPGRLVRAGARVGALELPEAFAPLAELHGTIWDYEIARCLADEHRRHRDRIREPLRAQLERGRGVSRRGLRRRAARSRANAAAGSPTRCTTSTRWWCPPRRARRPKGLASTGDSVFNRVWTLLHAPCVNVPAGRGPKGLPLGIQVVGRIGDDARVLACAHWIEMS